MKKNLLQQEVKEEIIQRILKLNPDATREWGIMNLNQMLRHTADGIRLAYGDIKSATTPPSWLVRQLMRFMILNTDMAAPKGKAKTFPEINMVEQGIEPVDFNAEKSALVEIIRSFPSKALAENSPLLGKMTRENWARLNYTHLDHHLKQFGV